MRVTSEMLQDTVSELAEQTGRNYRLTSYQQWHRLTYTGKNGCFYQTELLTKREIYYYLQGCWHIVHGDGSI